MLNKYKYNYITFINLFVIFCLIACSKQTQRKLNHSSKNNANSSDVKQYTQDRTLNQELADNESNPDQATGIDSSEPIEINEALFELDPEIEGDTASQIKQYTQLLNRKKNVFANLDNRRSLLINQLFNLAGGGCMLEKKIDMIKIQTKTDDSIPSTKIIRKKMYKKEQNFNDSSTKLTISLSANLSFDIDNLADFFKGTFQKDLTDKNITIGDIQYIKIHRHGFSITQEKQSEAMHTDDALTGKGRGKAMKLDYYTATESHRYRMNQLEIVAVNNKIEHTLYQKDSLEGDFFWPTKDFYDYSLIYGHIYMKLARQQNCD